MRMPFDSFFPITCDYGCHMANDVQKPTPGIDWALPTGTALFAVESGWLFQSVDQYGGKYSAITGNTGQWFYVHESSQVGTNRQIKEGELIGFSGASGLASGPHLHFGLKVNGTYVDPLNYLLINNMKTLNVPVETDSTYAQGYKILVNDSSNFLYRGDLKPGGINSEDAFKNWWRAHGFLEVLTRLADVSLGNNANIKESPLGIILQDRRLLLDYILVTNWPVYYPNEKSFWHLKSNWAKYQESLKKIKKLESQIANQPIVIDRQAVINDVIGQVDAHMRSFIK